MVVRLDGMVAQIMENLLVKGYYKTKAEIVRAGILELGKEYRILSKEQELDELAVRKMDKIDAQVKEGNIKLIPLDDVLKKAGINKRGLK